MFSSCLVLLTATLIPESARLQAIRTAAQQGMIISDLDERKIVSVGGENAARYGELTPHGFATLASKLGLNERDTVLDAGSGLHEQGRSVHAHRVTVVECVVHCGELEPSPSGWGDSSLAGYWCVSRHRSYRWVEEYGRSPERLAESRSA